MQIDEYKNAINSNESYSEENKDKNENKISSKIVSRIPQKVYEKLYEHFKNENEIENIFENFAMERLTEIDGISEKKAISLLQTYHGLDTSLFLKTERTEKLYTDIIETLKSYCSTSYAKNKMALLVPRQYKDIKDLEYMNQNIARVLEAKELVSTLPREDLRKCLSKVSRLRTPVPKFDSKKVILLENDYWLQEYRKKGLDRYVQIQTADDNIDLNGFDIVVYAYSDGSLDDYVSNADNVFSVPANAKEYEIVPECVLSWYYANYETLRNVANLRLILGKESIISEALSILDSVKQLEVDIRKFESVIIEERDRMNDELKKASNNINLAGEEVLEMLSSGTSKKIKQIFNEILQNARIRIKEKTGYDATPFIMKYPIEIDIEELERIKSSIVQRGKLESFSKKVKAAEKLASMKKKVEDEVNWAFEFDYNFALGCFAYDYDLSKPKLTEPKRRSSITPVGKYAFYTEGACHLELVRKGGTKIDYNFGSINEKERVVLLTGANSGGKTTLLETIAQIFIMAQMGLPVCAKECELTPFEELYFFTHKRNLDAGAFESFLKTFIPIACSNTRKLVLADELEAMTELEAASKIIAAFIEMINSTDSYSIIVTHMAGEISKHVDVRIDGIEAKGLDANFNLIVDRTPKIGVYAKSTPELIVMRLYERSNGELKKVYKKLLEKFQNVKKKSD